MFIVKKLNIELKSKRIIFIDLFLITYSLGIAISILPLGLVVIVDVTTMDMKMNLVK